MSPSCLPAMRLISVINWFTPTPPSRMSWSNYHRLDTIYSWLDRLAAKHPDLVAVETIGRTAEGRDIRLARVSSRSVIQVSWKSQQSVHYCYSYLVYINLSIPFH